MIQTDVLKILQYSQENACVGVSFLFVGTFRPATLSKKRLQHMCFFVNIAEFLRTAFLIDHLWWLLLFTFIKTESENLVFSCYYHKNVLTSIEQLSSFFFSKLINCLTCHILRKIFQIAHKIIFSLN